MLSTGVNSAVEKRDGGLAAAALGYGSVQDLQSAIDTYCEG
jgi:hypothetical protein